MSKKYNFKKVYVVIPAYNEEARISLCLNKAIRLGFENIIVVNDASRDNTSEVASSFPQVTVLDHLINLGPGGATETGIQYAIRQKAKYIATIDADFQHDPSDLVALYEKITSEDLDLVVGSRFLESNNIPLSRIIYNKIGNLVSFLLTRKYLTDSQSGIKIMTSDLAKKIALESNGFEFCIEIVSSAKRSGAKIEELPVFVQYTEETTRKGQNLSSGLSMMTRLFSPFN